MHAFSRAERRRIEASLAKHESPVCPRCGARLLVRPVEPGSAVAYVRHRVLLLCAGCDGHTSLDTPSTTRGA